MSRGAKPSIMHGVSSRGWVRIDHLKGGLVNITIGYAGKAVSAEIIDRAALVAALQSGGE
jgi:hypothetical protein